MGLKLSNEKGQNVTLLFRPDALCLSEPKAQICPVSTSPQQRLIRLSEGPLCLGEPEDPFFPIPSVNFRIYYSFVMTSIEVDNRHEFGLIDDPNK